MAKPDKLTVGAVVKIKDGIRPVEIAGELGVITSVHREDYLHITIYQVTFQDGQSMSFKRTELLTP